MAGIRPSKYCGPKASTRLSRKIEQRGEMMKKLLLTGLMLGTSVVFLPSAAEAKAAPSASADPQIRVQIGRNRGRRWGRTRRVVITTRVRWIGPYRYRETIRTVYLPNGRTRTQVISRVRLGRSW